MKRAQPDLRKLCSDQGDVERSSASGGRSIVDDDGATGIGGEIFFHFPDTAISTSESILVLKEAKSAGSRLRERGWTDDVSIVLGRERLVVESCFARSRRTSEDDYFGRTLT